MSVLSYQSIKLRCFDVQAPLISPYREKDVHKQSGLSGGASENGYDIHINQDITLYPITLWNLFLNSIGFKRPSFALASTVEYFFMPNDLMANVADKSTLARKGLALQNTILENSWRGYLTLELNCQGKNIIKLYKGQPIAQIIFFLLDEPAQKKYEGKYQNQGDFPQEAIMSK